MLCQNRKISTCSTAYFEHVFTRLRVHLRKQPVAAEQIVFSREIVKVPLVAVHSVHFFEGGRHREFLTQGRKAAKGRQVMQAKDHQTFLFHLASLRLCVNLCFGFP